MVGHGHDSLISMAGAAEYFLAQMLAVQSRGNIKILSTIKLQLSEYRHLDWEIGSFNRVQSFAGDRSAPTHFYR